MADGFDLHLDSDRAAKLKAAADRVGLSAADYALAVLDQAMTQAPGGGIDPDPAIDEAIADAVECGDEPSISLDDFRARLRRFGTGAD
ncbi:MAG: antitoxin [Alphaproteobacteria bacterium]|nr:antitoxin [Alphaproteobacteria bacterium]